MNRRSVLAGTSIALSACVSGCGSESDPADDERGDETNDEENTSDDENADGTDDQNETGGQDASDDDQNTSDEENETDGSETGPDRVETIRIVLRNVASAARTVTVTVSGDDETRLDEERQVEPDSQTAIDSGLSEPGGYELTVTVENGPTTTRPFAVDDYDLSEGTDIIVEISDDDVSVVMQE
jgi:hypothetical protein